MEQRKRTRIRLQKEVLSSNEHKPVISTTEKGFFWPQKMGLEKNQKSFSPKNILLKSVEHKRTDFSTSVTKFSPPPFFNDFKNVIVHFPNHTFYLPLSRVSPVNQVQIQQRRPKNTCEFSSFEKMRFFKISARSRNFGQTIFFVSHLIS